MLFLFTYIDLFITILVQKNENGLKEYSNII